MITTNARPHENTKEKIKIFLVAFLTFISTVLFCLAAHTYTNSLRRGQIKKITIVREKNKSELYQNIAAIVTACKKYDIPVDWGLAQTYTESTWDAGQITPEKGKDRESIGLGQILLSTARLRNKKIRKGDLLVPQINADACMAHLAELLKAHKGNMEAALLEYNGGDNWKQKGRGYYLRVKKNRALIFNQETTSEKDNFINYYFNFCNDTMHGGRRLARP